MTLPKSSNIKRGLPDYPLSMESPLQIGVGPTAVIIEAGIVALLLLLVAHGHLPNCSVVER